jgi:hypothetical protein
MAQFKKYRCQECEHLYDEELGDPDSGLAPGTSFPATTNNNSEKYRFNCLVGSLFASFAPTGAVNILLITIPRKAGT